MGLYIPACYVRTRFPSPYTYLLKGVCLGSFVLPNFIDGSAIDV